MLNKKTGLLCIFFCMVTFNPSAVELWNGFTAGMTRDEAKNFLKNNFKLKGRFYEGTKGAPFPGSVKINGQEYNLPEAEKLRCQLADEAYRKGFPNLVLYFLSGKLFAVDITWNVNEEDLFQKSVEKYGDRYDKIVTDVETKWDTGGGDMVFTDVNKYAYRWRLEGKDFFLYDKSFCIAAPDMAEKWYAEQEELEKNRKEQEEEKARKNAGDVAF